MKWTTWENVGVDRIACAWLIKRFIDTEAEFTFIPSGSSQIPANEEPFDIPGVRYSHHRGHCSFHTIVKEFQLKDPVLHHIARIVDEADTLQEITLEPIAAGLDAICSGIRLTSKDDHEALNRGFEIYQALYSFLERP
ncbi:chromate resistance protein ChrB domain-containing protein [Paenibacillus sp. OV219]|uniref:chromate resistance protein ChrB domain-containing protein n=1 Tax=Paenibacillus sp. OV219 TaxID=1884377 RepID=UPI0008B7992D|nr:chromate resistance protein ChrB domain-containing protein [Paenibacillus sp. OV219]SEP16212.1 hypothetical protein SAMN05518847_1228 [Paenibacillus sp. OV219]